MTSVKQQLIDKYAKDDFERYEHVLLAAIEFKYGVEAEVVVHAQEDDYQGCSTFIAKDSNNKYYYYSYSWGSCSGCDALQAEGGEALVSEYVPIQLDEDKVIEYMEKEKINQIYNGAMIDEAVEQFKKYLENKN